MYDENAFILPRTVFLYKIHHNKCYFEHRHCDSASEKMVDFISLQMDQLVSKRWPFTSSKGIHNEGCSLWKSLLLMIARGLLTVRESPEVSGMIFFTCVITLALSSLLFWKVKREVICYKERINPAVWLPLGCVTVLITGAKDIMDKLTVTTYIYLFAVVKSNRRKAFLCRFISTELKMKNRSV